MFDEICARIPKDSDYPDRTWVLDVRKRVLDGTIYSVLPYHFHNEFNPNTGEYIPLKERRPSVRYNLCRIVVQDSVSMLFGEGRFPLIHSENEDVRGALAKLVKETHLVETMSDAAIRGSIGSVAILMRVLKGRVFFDVLDTLFLTPTWDPEAPDTLQRVVEKYKVPGSSLREMGYTIADDDVNQDFWFQRMWDTASETWYMPWRVHGEEQGVTGRGPERIDNQRTVQHNLGFVPVAWIKNLPGGASKIDGACTFRPAVDTQIEMEYQLSQAGRGLKYSSDPLLMIREPAGGDNKQLVRSASSALIVSEKGDAKLLEIDGRAAAAVIEYCRALRELALESIHGNRANADKLSAAQSGRALELLHQPLVWLTDKMRTSYGEYGLLHLIGMVIKASKKVEVRIMGEKVDLDPNGPITLNWGTWFPATEQDRAAQASALESHRKAGHLSRETAVRSLSQNYGIEDVDAELAKIETDLKAEDERLINIEKAKVQATAPIEG